MTRTRVMSRGKGRRNADFMQSARDNPPELKPGSRQREYRGGNPELIVSVERERVPGNAVPGDAVPGDAVPRDAVPDDAVPRDAVPEDAVPGEVIPGGAVPDQGVPGERRPENAARQRIFPIQGRTKKDRVERSREAVRGPEPLIDARHTGHGLERAKEETAARRGRATGRRVHGGVRVEQPAAVRDWVGENLAAVLPVRLRRPDKERLDLIRGERRPSLQEERGGARHDSGRHRRSGQA